MNVLTKVGMNVGLKLRKYSPEILIGTGVVAMVGAGVMASRATLKVEEVIDHHRDVIERCETSIGKEYLDENGEAKPYTEEVLQQDKFIQYTQTAVSLVKLYGPSVTLAGAGIFCILSGTNILKKRNVALVAAYKLVEQGFMDYRGKVINELGEAKDQEFKNGIKTKKIKESYTDDDGKKKSKTKEVQEIEDPNDISMYAKIYDCTCKGWRETPDYNLLFLKAQQAYWNDKLKLDGVVYLNDVYKSLGIEPTKAGQVVGWKLTEDGDNYIDFGLYENERFINGLEANVLLDFNVDGVVWG